MKQNRKLIISLWAVGLVALVLAALFWRLRVERDDAVTRQPRYLSRLGSQVMLYKIAHGGKYPADLDAMARELQIPDAELREIQRLCWYLAGAWGDRRMPGKAVVACSTPRVGLAHANVLLEDGNVIAVPASLIDDVKADSPTAFLLVDKGQGQYEVQRYELLGAVRQPATQSSRRARPRPATDA